jgi:hypothetical protein
VTSVLSLQHARIRSVVSEPAVPLGIAVIAVLGGLLGSWAWLVWSAAAVLAGYSLSGST